jgi:polyphosphate kinase
MTTPPESAAAPPQESIRAVPRPVAPPEPASDLKDTSLYVNRELSWLDFNDRVLQLAEDGDQPLLERAKFAAIFTSNLDEYFMIRVAGLLDQVEAGVAGRKADGLSAGEVLDRIRQRVLEMGERQSEVVEDVLRPELAEHGIEILSLEDLSSAQRAAIDDRFIRQIFPVLTPLGVGLGRPFPYISNLSLSLAVLVRDPVNNVTTFARVKVPKEMLPRFVPVDDTGTAFVPLEDIIAANLEQLFPGMEVVDHGVFRVTRDADYEISDEADDLLQAVEAELRRRRFGEVVRVEFGGRMSTQLRDELISALDVDAEQVYDVDGLLDLKDLWQIVGVKGFDELRDPPWKGVTQPRIQGEQDEPPSIMAAMRQADVLVHHPYDAFATSVERFVDEAVADPDVLAIKQTVYRTSDDSPLVPALIRASESGKQAVCMVELKARFDERSNITWARTLEEAGVHVVYGIPGLKTHAKCILVVRREGDGVRHYVHIGTGNYHAKTAKLYTDFGLFTCDERIGADVSDMFNVLTGFARPKRFRKVLVAPQHLRDGILAEVDAAIEAQRAGGPSRITMKMNSLVDRRSIEKLYEASQAGVQVDINVRGICCLVPGVPGVSDNIRVVSVVGRFLEHARIYAFDHSGEQRVYIGSADLMPRNLDTRVELITPVLDPVLRDDLLDTLDRCFADNTNSWELGADGTWARLHPPEGTEPRNVQRELMAGHLARAAESGRE